MLYLNSASSVSGGYTNNVTSKYVHVSNTVLASSPRPGDATGSTRVLVLFCVFGTEPGQSEAGGTIK